MHKTMPVTVAALFVIVAMLAMAIPASPTGTAAVLAADTAQDPAERVRPGGQQPWPEGRGHRHRLLVWPAAGGAGRASPRGKSVGGHCLPARGGEQRSHHPDARLVFIETAIIYALLVVILIIFVL